MRAVHRKLRRVNETCEWVVLDHYNSLDIIGCSKCRTPMGIKPPTSKYCPECGRKVRKK